MLTAWQPHAASSLAQVLFPTHFVLFPVASTSSFGHGERHGIASKGRPLLLAMLSILLHSLLRWSNNRQQSKSTPFIGRQLMWENNCDATVRFLQVTKLGTEKNFKTVLADFDSRNKIVGLLR